MFSPIEDCPTCRLQMLKKRYRATSRRLPRLAGIGSREGRTSGPRALEQTPDGVVDRGAGEVERPTDDDTPVIQELLDLEGWDARSRERNGRVRRLQWDRIKRSDERGLSLCSHTAVALRMVLVDESAAEVHEITAFNGDSDHGPRQRCGATGGDGGVREARRIYSMIG